ncbi:hypothetical protein NQZ68_036566 [Dissostichus eleginoides]|nr:hypothetical protein NQZ68_036566 [Dissostichus eleginoides]
MEQDTLPAKLMSRRGRAVPERHAACRAAARPEHEEPASPFFSQPEPAPPPSAPNPSACRPSRPPPQTVCTFPPSQEVLCAKTPVQTLIQEATPPPPPLPELGETARWCLETALVALLKKGG